MWKAGDCSVKTYSASCDYSITTPSGRIVNPPAGYCWRYSKEKFEELRADNRIWFGPTGNNVPAIKRFLSDVKQGATALTVWTYDEVGHNQDAKKEVKEFNSSDVFATPKPEKLIHRILTLATNPGDLVLDSFLGSGTTAAVAHKMGRRWIGIEMGDHIYSHCLPRLKKVIDCENAGGITKSVKWQGGGGFKFYELGSTLIVTDKHGRQVISDKYNPEMLAEAMCKLMGYKYAPDKETYWKQGYSSEKNFIFTTTMNVEEQLLAEMSQALGDGNLLICCGAFTGNKTAYDNITIKKIPQAILKKCQWGSAGYPLPIREDFSDEDFEFEDEE